jgi:hypothetical protein
MKAPIAFASLIASLLMPAFVTAAPLASREPVAIGAEVGTIAAGALMGAAAGGISVDLPLTPAWSLGLEPSGYWATGVGSSVLQLNLEGTLRFHLMSLFVDDHARPTHWGPFLAAGADASWERARVSSSLAILSLGPVLKAGYRLVFGEHGIFLEPSIGWMALFGVELGSGGGSSISNAGATAGLILGYRI